MRKDKKKKNNSGRNTRTSKDSIVVWIKRMTFKERCTRLIPTVPVWVCVVCCCVAQKKKKKKKVKKKERDLKTSDFERTVVFFFFLFFYSTKNIWKMEKKKYSNSHAFARNVSAICDSEWHSFSWWINCSYSCCARIFVYLPKILNRKVDDIKNRDKCQRSNQNEKIISSKVG